MLGSVAMVTGMVPEPDRCPHCRAVTAPEPAAADRYRCPACGGPRLVVDPPLPERSHAEEALLIRAEAVRVRAGVLVAAGAALASLGALGLAAALVALVALGGGALSLLITLSVALVPLLLGVAVVGRGRKHQRAFEAALDEAELVLAREILGAQGAAVGAPELAAQLRLSDARAEALLTELVLRDLATRTVTDAASLSYVASGRPRVALPSPDSPGERLEAAAAPEPSRSRRD